MEAKLKPATKQLRCDDCYYKGVRPYRLPCLHCHNYSHWVDENTQDTPEKTSTASNIETEPY